MEKKKIYVMSHFGKASQFWIKDIDLQLMESKMQNAGTDFWIKKKPTLH